MSADALAALSDGMAATHAGDLSTSASADRRRSSAPTAELEMGADQALGTEIWGLMDILTENLYDPDEQVRTCYKTV